MNTTSRDNKAKKLTSAALIGGAAIAAGFAAYKLYKKMSTAKESGGWCGCMGSTAVSPTPAPARQPRVVFVLGGPGAGKGTQCANLVREFGFVHLSAGDLLRAEQNRPESEVGSMIKRLIIEGQIVPVAVTLGLLKTAMKQNMDEGRYNFLIDGFPRNYDNLEGWQREMSGFAQVEFCLFLDCPEEVMEARLLKRGESSGRSDDNAEAIKKRFLTYVESTRPVIDTFAKQGKMHQVSAAASVEDVWKEIETIFKQIDWTK